MSGNRHDSYQELKAWATRHGLSLPRRKNTAAESRGRSNGLLVSSETPGRDIRTWTNLQVVALDNIRQSAKIKESKLRVGGDGRQTHQLQAPLCDFCPPVDTRDKTSFQKMMFSQPPGYVAPPSYDSPHTTTPVIPHGHTSCEQENKRHNNWTRTTPKTHDVEVRRRAENQDRTKPTAKKTCDITDITPGNDYTFKSLNLETDKPMTPKVIEGKRFRIRRKTGGLTIFCLVSRIADATETPSLPLSRSHKDVQDATNLVAVLKDRGEIHQTQTFADEVDFRVSSPAEPPTFSSRDDTTKEKKILEITDDCRLKTSEMPSFCPEKNDKNESNSTLGRRETFVEPVSPKYPLWRTPRLTRTAATERDRVESNHPGNQENDNVHPVDVDVRDLDRDLDRDLVPDTSCVVKMELVPSPKKDHVCYLSSTVNTEENTSDISSSTSPPNQEVISDLQFNFPQIKDRCVNESGCGLEENKSFTCPPPFTSSKKETLEERAERILGISVQSFVTEKHQEAPHWVDLCAEHQDDGSKLSPHAGDVHVEEELISENSDESLESCQTDTQALRENRDPEEQVENEDEFLQNVSQLFTGFEEKNKNSETLEGKDINMSEPTNDKGPDEQNQDEEAADNSSTKSQFCQSFSTSSVSSEFNPNSPLHETPSTTDEDPSPELALLNTSENHTHFSDPPGRKNSSSISSPLHFDLTPESKEPPSNDEIPDNSKKSKFVNDEICDVLMNLEDQDVVSTVPGEESDITDEGQTEDDNVLEKQLHGRQAEDAACGKEPQISEEHKADTDPAELGETTATNEISGGQTREKVNVWLQHLVNDKDGLVSCENETFVTGETAEREISERTSCFCQTPDEHQSDFDQEESVLCKIISQDKLHLDSAENLSTNYQNNSADCLGQVQAEILQLLNPGDETSDPDCEFSSSSNFSEVPSSPHASQKDSNSLNDCLEMDSFMDHPSNMSTSSHERQYPKSLWDAVNRIRKHTAPDSENEEEEVGEQWDPEITEEDLGSLDTLLAFNHETLVTGGYQVLTEPCDIDQSRCAEDDTLSCCSFSSHSSGDTVIGEEEEAEKIPPDQSSTTTDEDEEQCCVEESDERE